MSATDELRRMLDERDVEYEVYRDIKNRCITRWRTYHGAFVFFAVEKEGELFVETASDTEHSAICTPEQAIAATLGSGTCENVAPDYLDFLCSKCGFVHYHSDENDTGDGNDWSYCPRCGKAVKR